MSFFGLFMLVCYCVILDSQKKKKKRKPRAEIVLTHYFNKFISQC